MMPSGNSLHDVNRAINRQRALFASMALTPGLCHIRCRRGLLLVRGVFGFGAIGNYLWAVTLLPLNDTLVLTFTAPIWAAVLGPFLIKEKASKCAPGLAPCTALLLSQSLPLPQPQAAA